MHSGNSPCRTDIQYLDVLKSLSAKDVCYNPAHRLPGKAADISLQIRKPRRGRTSPAFTTYWFLMRPDHQKVLLKVPVINHQSNGNDSLTQVRPPQRHKIVLIVNMSGQ